MSKFAKLFEIGDSQLLVITRLSEEGYPQVACMTEIDGDEVCVAPTFEPKYDDQESLDAAWTAADKYFNSFDLEKAEAIYSEVVKQSLLMGVSESNGYVQ